MADLRYTQRDLRNETASCMPAVMHSLKPTALAVAILKPNRKPEGPKNEDDFLWIKCSEVCSLSVDLGHLTDCNQRTTGIKLRVQCQIKMGTTLQEDFVLKHGLKILDWETPMSEIVHQGDRLVVLEVVAKSDFPSRLPSDRQPLQPTK